MLHERREEMKLDARVAVRRFSFMANQVRIHEDDEDTYISGRNGGADVETFGDV